MSVDYNDFAKSFAESRKDMRWEELEYFFSFLTGRDDEVLDIGCGSGRFLEQYKKHFGKFPKNYLGVDLSEGLLEEAQKTFPNQNFLQGNMEDIYNIVAGKKYKNVFLIASFHHLENLEKREQFFKQLKDVLTEDGKIYMTNWALESPLNKEKYTTSEIIGSQNNFFSKDFSIKFGEIERYYHSFSLKELEYLAEVSGLTIEENRLFDTQKNIITIFKK